MPKAKRVCSIPGCPRVQAESKCVEHRREAERARGTTVQRGYGAEHAALKAKVQRRIDAGEVVPCWRCGVRLTGTAWHLDHTSDRTGYRGPACIPCNLHLAGKARHR